MIAVSALILSACGGSNTAQEQDDRIADAEQAFADSDWTEAQKLCNSLTANGLDNLSEQQLGRLAILYMKLSEVPNGGEHAAEATQCYLKAWEISADSLTSFTNGLPPEDLQYIMVLNRLGGAIISPPDLSREFEQEDIQDHQEAEATE